MFFYDGLAKETLINLRIGQTALCHNDIILTNRDTVSQSIFIQVNFIYLVSVLFGKLVALTRFG